ncbi:MAG: molybdopterin-binding protein [Gammaproteobacteria bacterium]|nr:molybdopterin-binding protein [Gammaproteobacteria bacterium]
MATIKYLCVNPKKGGVKHPVSALVFKENEGILNDAHAKEQHRQVSLLTEEDIRALGKPALKPGAFSENITLEGINSADLGMGSRLQLGEEVILSISQVGKTLHPTDNVVRMSDDHIMARVGLFARVERGGTVNTGDHVKLLDVVPRSQIQAVVLTISDRCSRGEAVDTAGPATCERLEQGIGAQICHTEIIPDEQQLISERLKHYCDKHSIDLIVTAGGTGFSPRDVTPEATRAVVDRLTPGFDEAMRYASMAKTPHAMLSRCASGMRGSTLIINLPGSKRAAVENIDAILVALKHGLLKLRGDPSDCDASRSEHKHHKSAI